MERAAPDLPAVDAGAMVDDLAALVAVESPSSDVGALERAADAVAALGARCTGVEPERLAAGDRPFLHWTFGPGPTRVLLVGHLDTVWPLGTLARWPFEVRAGHATGPGAFDMKAGLVQGFHALASLRAGRGAGALDGVAVVVNADEELGSPGSRRAIEEAAEGAIAALVLEPSAAGGALKTARKGVSLYDLDITGRAAHAGLEPERGVNATVELAHQVLALGAVAGGGSPATTVTPTIAAAGTTQNTVPASATLHVDVRAETLAEQARVDAAVRALRPVVDGARVDVRGGPNRPPFEPSASADLFGLAQSIAAGLGLAPLRGVAVGGGSDGNFTAGMGVPTLDGLGAVGDHAHGEGEYVVVDAMPGRAALVAALVAALAG